MSLAQSGQKITNKDIPVLLTIFNRPEKTRDALENLKQVEPGKLFIAADGPRLDMPEDTEKCRRSRKEALNITWDCQVETRFLEKNIGVGSAVSQAIDWFFENVEFGIIIEDDCLIDDQFFSLCREINGKYADDERIMQISSLSLFESRNHPYDYHFSRLFRCSGAWGSWRRAWQYYSSNMHDYADYDAIEIIKSCYPDYAESMKLYHLLRECKADAFKQPDCNHYWSHWDLQWYLACMAQNGLCIIPEKNLMVNKGFDEESTHTKKPHPMFEHLQLNQLTFPLKHPKFVYADSRPERKLSKKLYRSMPFRRRIAYLLRRLIGTCRYLRRVMPSTHFGQIMDK